jgi:hypothetical protein
MNNVHEILSVDFSTKGRANSNREGCKRQEMNKKQIYILILAIIAFAVCILFNFRDLIFIASSDAATITAMVDARPMLAELVIMVIVFGILFMKFKTPKKRG